MFNQLGDRLKQTFQGLRGRGRLTEDHVIDALRDVRVALLEADVALPAVKTFIDRVRSRAVGQEVSRSLNPGQAVVKIVYDELVELMGAKNDSLDLAVQPPAVVLVTGLQGTGKTTTVAKLAYHLRMHQGKRVLVTSTDVYRPAARDQLQRLAIEVEVDYCDDGASDPIAIANQALEQARRGGYDVLIIDTAGRLHIDDEMMLEVRKIHASVNPVETLFVVDSMTGQDAVNSAGAFNEQLDLTGVILTKTDGDARGEPRFPFGTRRVGLLSSLEPERTMMHSIHFIRTELHLASLAWVMCYPWLKRLNARSIEKKPKRWPAN